MHRHALTLAPKLLLIAFPFVVCIASSATALSISGVVPFSTDATGSYCCGQYYNTVGSDFPWNVWVVQGGVGDAFLNGPDDAGAAVDIALSPGTYTFSLFARFGFDPGYWGLNLFFDGNTASPGISVFAATDLSTISDPSFGATSGSTPNQDTTSFSVPGAGTLTFTDGSSTVTLTGFRWSDPSVDSLDRVGDYSVGPDGAMDFVGQFTLQVVPEPATAMLLSLGLVGVAGSRRYGRQP